MKIAKGLMLVGLGIGSTIAYQKYSKPAMKQIEKLFDKTVKKIEVELDEMM